MNKTIGLQLLVYSLLLAGLSYLTHYLAPAFARPTLITGLAGGALCLVSALRAIAGNRGKTLPLLTLIPVSFVILSQTVLAWGGGSQGAPWRMATAVMTVLFALSIAMLMRIAYAGALGPRQTGAAGGAAGESNHNKGKSINRRR